MATTPQEPLQDRLKEQVAVSVKDALERTTAILSNLHRVQSYLDILQTMSTSPSGGAQGGLKNAMLQMHSVRTDVASLLQTVYLAEIGIQSLQDYDKGGVASSTPLPSIIPTMLPMSDDDSVGEESEGGVADLQVGVVSQQVGVVSQQVGVVDDGAGTMTIDVGYEELPPAKRSKGSDGQVSITSCSMCGKKFANQSSSTVFLCRVCRQSHTPDGLSTQPHPSTSSAKRKSDSTPRGSRGGRGNLNRMSCKLCGASFLYKRCLHRHIRENHVDLDLSNMAQYIQMGGATDSEAPVDTPTFVGGVAPRPPALTFDRGNDEDQRMLLSITEEMGVSPVMGGDGMGALTPQGEPPKEGGEGEEGVAMRDKYVCQTCNKMFDRPYRLQRHIQIHNPDRPRVTCHLCDKAFTRVDTLENHMKCLHSNDRPFKCTFSGCLKRFPLQSALVHHLKVHMDGKPYKCNECESSFALLGEFRTHITEVHADTKDLRCTECYKVFPSTTELSQHVKLEHRLECEVCMKTFSRLAYLQTHIQVHSGQSMFNCRYCLAGFDSEYAYKKHIKSHPKPPKATPTSHLCSVCDQGFANIGELVEHYRSVGHREKVEAMGLDGTSILHTIEGDLSPEIRSLVDEVTGSIGTAEVDERLMQSIQGLRATTVTIDAVEEAGYQIVEGEGPKGVRFEVAGEVYGRGDPPRPED